MSNTSRYRIIRAIQDLRLGLPIVLHSKDKAVLLAAPETVSQDTFAVFASITRSTIYTVITDVKAEVIYQKKQYLRIKTTNINDLTRILSAKHSNDLLQYEVSDKVDDEDLFVINLIKSAELLPYALISEIEFNTQLFRQHELRVITKHDDIAQNNHIEQICSVPLVLYNAKHAQIAAYKVREKMHYAITIGNPFKRDNALVRIHSACYTGDLLNSLMCDCHAQLHSAIEIMNKNPGGGIILYLMQDGRGIGLINKLRTYHLQSCYKLDTVEANRALGFNDDERDFWPGAAILKQLDITTIRLVTNNPNKVTQLKRYGIRVSKCIPHLIKHNQHNVFYLQTKFNKMGHKIF